MWLLPVLSRLSRFAVTTFYRLTVSGPGIPEEGPLLLVSNHPNAFVDAAFVAAIAGRPVRFLAKATLFDNPGIGLLVRGAGCIPVYRRTDDPALMARNEDAFRAAREALRDGAAIALFPEGLSHSEPALMPLKTGAARIALGTGRAFAIVPVGIVLRAPEVFRSEACAVIGKPVAWDDLAERGGDDPEAIRSLTERMDRALRRVTVNLEQWEDEPLVATAEAVWAAETGASGDAVERVARLTRIAERLRSLRAADDPRWKPLARRLHGYRRKLSLLGLTPRTVALETSAAAARRWTARRVPLVLTTIVALVGGLVFWVPYQVVGAIDRRVGLNREMRATQKLFGGAAVMAAWIGMCAVAAGLAAGPWAAAAALGGLPLLGLGTLWLREWWGERWREARRYLVLRFRPGLRDDLRSEQRALARDLDRLRGDP